GTKDELLREAVQRYVRWVGALNTSIPKGRWTSAEDAALIETVSRYLNAVDSQGNLNQYHGIKTGAQCQARWTEASDPRIKKGSGLPVKIVY
ncbi:18021_t:CDS:2, partial [Dentiscutata erythropus]